MTQSLRPSLKASFAGLAFFSLVVASPTVQAQSAEVQRPASFTLANGLQIVVIPDRRTPVVTHMIWYKVGSADETPGKSGLAHFLEHLMFKGTDALSRRPVLADGDPHRRPGERLHLDRLHRIFPARAARQARHPDGIRGRSHDRPDAEGRERAARARRGARRVQHARRQQSGQQAVRADHGGALSQPPLWPPGDRLAARDRAAQSRGCAGILQALLRAEQRDAGGRRRRRARRGAQARGEDLRPAGKAAVDPGAARAAAGAAADLSAHGDARRPQGRAAERAPLLSGAVGGHGRGG